MTRLTAQQVQQNGGDGKGRDDTVSSVSLTHRALSDVSCLSEFKSLERLDLAFNNLSSLDGLTSCTNLKWLSVTQNKLESLQGIERMHRLTVFNAGKNKIKSMEPVGSLESLRALILNDNEISKICQLDRLKELNTLVLSRNPIREIGESLKKVKSITKLSVSHCNLEAIGSSLTSCTELREFRLAHNDIKTLPTELACNKKLQSLDVGNNAITRWSDVKVLGSLTHLKNLNLFGNPLADNPKLTNKVKNALPQLHVFNAKPLLKREKNVQIEKHEIKEQKRKIRSLETEEVVPSAPKDEAKSFLLEEEGRKTKGKDLGKKSGELDIIDDSESSFADIVTRDFTRKGNSRVNGDGCFHSVQAGASTKRKKPRSKALDLPVFEIGLGGPSTWGDG